MPTKRQRRSEKKLKNAKKQKTKYPKLVRDIIFSSDIILQILDARFPEQTRNHELEKEITKQNKRLIYVLNKSDLAQKKKVNLIPHVFVSSKTRVGVKRLRDLIKKEKKNIKKEPDEKTIIGIIGYPNTGKSSLINVLTGKASAKTGADAGFTKGIQKLKLTNEITLLDTPGVIPNSEYSGVKTSAIAEHTIVGGRSHSQVKNPEIVIHKIIKEFKGVLEKHYKLNAKGNSEIILEKLGIKFNFLKKGGEVDTDKTARKILKDWQEGIIKI
ncbi:MAG: GTPase [archaeon]